LPESKPIVPGKVRLADKWNGASRPTIKEKRDSPLRLAGRPTRWGAKGKGESVGLLRSEYE